MSNGYVEHEEILICLMDFSCTSLYNSIMLEIQDDLTTLISNWKLLNNLCNKYSERICLNIEWHPILGTASTFYRWIICQ